MLPTASENILLPISTKSVCSPFLAPIRDSVIVVSYSFIYFLRGSLNSSISFLEVVKSLAGSGNNASINFPTPVLNAASFAANIDLAIALADALSSPTLPPKNNNDVATDSSTSFVLSNVISATVSTNFAPPLFKPSLYNVDKAPIGSSLACIAAPPVTIP